MDTKCRVAKRNIVVIGGGFAGTMLVKTLGRKLPPEWQAVLISKENYMMYTPLLAEVAGASLLPGQAVAPIRKMLRRSLYYRATVDEIDLERRCITCQAEHPQSLQYDHLVFACGKVPHMHFIEGMSADTLPLKTLGDALYLRNRIIVSFERLEMEMDTQLRRRLMTFIIIGGGSSGVEVAGSVADFITAAHKFYPSASKEEFRIIVLESGERLLSEFPAPLGDSALKHMRKNGIDVHLQTRVVRITKTGVQTKGGDWIEGDNIICTIGTEPNPLIQRLAIPKQKGLIQTRRDMSVDQLSNVWAIGDCAAVMNTYDDSWSPPTAQFASQQGKQLADNILRSIRGESTRPFHYRSRGQLATIGHHKAVAHVFGIQLSGFGAWCWSWFFPVTSPSYTLSVPRANQPGRNQVKK